MYRSPRLEMPPLRSLPPLEFWRGVSPSQAAKSRADVKDPGSTAVAAIAEAVIGPTPGTDVRRRLT